jgi:hypothetical protein
VKISLPGPAPHPSYHTGHLAQSLPAALLSMHHVIDSPLECALSRPWLVAERGGFLLEDGSTSDRIGCSTTAPAPRLRRLPVASGDFASRLTVLSMRAEPQRQQCEPVASCFEVSGSAVNARRRAGSLCVDLEPPRRSTAVSATARPPCLVCIGASPPDTAASSQTQDTRLWSLKCDSRRL